MMLKKMFSCLKTYGFLESIKFLFLKYLKQNINKNNTI